MRKITQATRKAAQRKHKARLQRKGLGRRPATKRELNKTSPPPVVSHTQAIASMVRAPRPASPVASVHHLPVMADPLAAFHALPIEEMNLGVASYNALKSEGINTVGALVARSRADLLRIRNIGDRRIDLDILPKLRALDTSLKLKDEPTTLAA